VRRRDATIRSASTQLCCWAVERAASFSLSF
jgi:hypothetical protein